MNIHSPGEMQETKSKIGDVSVADRRAQILDAAERSFCRSGFHRATMHDVAAEAGMSPGNLYRYFPSKDALVAGLCERDRARPEPGIHRAWRRRRRFPRCLPRPWQEALRRGQCRQSQALPRDLGRSHPQSGDCRAPGRFRPHPRGPACRGVRARQGGRAGHPAVNARAVASIVSKLGDGLFVRRAVAADFDPDREFGEVFAVIEALLEGTIAIPAAAAGQERPQ